MRANHVAVHAGRFDVGRVAFRTCRLWRRLWAREMTENPRLTWMERDSATRVANFQCSTSCTDAQGVS